MALPGVTTVLQDRFYLLSRTDIPTGPRIVTIAPRLTHDTGTVADYDPYLATSEANVVTQFGTGSGCHRAYLELVSAGAARIYIVALPVGTTDANLLLTTSGNPIEQAFAAAETAQPDIIVPWGRGGHPTEWENPATPGNEPSVFGFYADAGSGSANIALRVADACQDITNRSHPCFGVLGIKPFVNTANTSATMSAAQIASHLGLVNLPNKETAIGANGQYVSVVGLEVIPSRYPESYGYANGACTYAGHISQLNAWSSPTGKVLFNVQQLRYSPTRTQQDTIITKGVMPVALDFNRVPRWIDAATFAKIGSDYGRLSTLRVIFDAVNMVRQKAQGYIGETASLQTRNALETDITSGLREMQIAGALLASDMRVTYLPADSKALVDLVLRIFGELRNIDVTVSVTI